MEIKVNIHDKEPYKLPFETIDEDNSIRIYMYGQNDCIVCYKVIDNVLSFEETYMSIPHILNSFTNKERIISKLKMTMEVHE